MWDRGAALSLLGEDLVQDRRREVKKEVCPIPVAELIISTEIFHQFRKTGERSRVSFPLSDAKLTNLLIY